MRTIRVYGHTTIECPYCDHGQTFEVTETHDYHEPVECLYCDALFVVSAKVAVEFDLDVRGIDGGEEQSDENQKRKYGDRSEDSESAGGAVAVAR